MVQHNHEEEQIQTDLDLSIGDQTLTPEKINKLDEVAGWFDAADPELKKEMPDIFSDILKEPIEEDI